MMLKIPKDIVKKLDELRAYFHKSKTEMLKQAIVEYVVIMKQTKFCLENPELILSENDQFKF